LASESGRLSITLNNITQIKQKEKKKKTTKKKKKKKKKKKNPQYSRYGRPAPKSCMSTCHCTRDTESLMKGWLGRQLYQISSRGVFEMDWNIF
jgi:hypothetical protein